MEALQRPITFDNPCAGHATGLPGLLFTQVVQFLIAAQCGLGNSKDYPSDYGDSLTDNEQFDFIVIGAGRTTHKAQKNVLLGEKTPYRLPAKK